MRLLKRLLLLFSTFGILSGCASTPVASTCTNEAKEQGSCNEPVRKPSQVERDFGHKR